MGCMHHQVSYTMVRPVTLKFKLTLLHFSAVPGGVLGIEQPYWTILTFLVLKCACRQILGDTVQCEKWWLVHFTLVHNFNTTRAVKKQTLTALFVWLQVPNYICKHRVHGSWKKPKMDSPAAGRWTVWLWHGMNPLSVSDTGKRLVWVMINFIQIICRYILYVQNYNPVYTCSHRNILGTQTKKIVVCWRKRLLLLEEMKRWRFRL